MTDLITVTRLNQAGLIWNSQGIYAENIGTYDDFIYVLRRLTRNNPASFYCLLR